MTYSREETVKHFTAAADKMDELYKDNCVNWVGTVKGEGDFYTEIISAELLKNLTGFMESIPKISRQSSYYRKNHCKIEIDFCTSTRNEENFAKRITGLVLDDVGLILDYQVPLKEDQQDTGIGKIDLVSYRKDQNVLYLLELKYTGNKETLLRAILESYTYFRIINQNKLIEDINREYKIEKSKILGPVISEGATVVPAVLVAPGCNAYNELREMTQSGRPKLLELSRELGLKFFILDIRLNEFVP